MASIEELYKYYETLTDSKEKAGQYEKEFLSIIASVKGGSAEKRLASQLISRFFKYFPQHTEKAMNAQLDLCEDEDVNIRKQAIRDLPAICKESPENLPRIADVLTQLLQTDDSGEHNLVQNALLTLMRSDMKGALQGIFSQIINGDDPIREKAIKFLSIKLKLMGEELVTNKIEELVVEESKKVLEDVTADEFLMFMSILSGLRCMQTLQGRQHLVDIISLQAGFDCNFDATDVDCVEKVLACTQQAMALFSKNVHSTKFVAYYLDQVVGQIAKVGASGDGEDTKLELLKQLADMSQWCPDLEKLPEGLKNLYVAIQEYMPLPPPEVIDLENTENSTPTPALQFSYVECLLFTLHQFGRRCPEFLSAPDNAEVTERAKDFKIRLQYFARGVASYIKQLRADLQGKKPDSVKSDEDKVKMAAYRTTTNIQHIIKDLMHVPPSYKVQLKLSWKPASEPAPVAAKRSSTETSAAVKSKNVKTGAMHMDRVVYAPPTGKFSDKAGTAPVGAGRGRGGRRGRGIWRPKY
ncbi:apoptosis inhibitor 5-like [Watersipora subatra]|uniref:apoptosis inhibitor 5-like n=1 Tax=Watersipora subatra TaxID=2589382 RepID=UPI00355C95CB